jgi:hAT family C-terminal dimerisation region
MFSRKSASSTAMNQHEFDRDFMVWMALDLEPFSMVENRGLRFFFKKNFPQVTIPSESSMRKTYVIDVYDFVADQVKRDLTAVQTITLMFDGWTDKHHAIHYLGIRAQFITDDWLGKVVTLSVKPCKGDSDSICDHIRHEVAQFMPNYKQKDLFTTHDGASAMKKVSRLLHVLDFMHCVAHALHLMLATDSIAQVPAITGLLRKCKEIVNVLHFKAELLENEVLASNDVIACTELLDKIHSIKSVIDVDDQLVIEDEDDNAGSDDYRSLGDDDSDTELSEKIQKKVDAKPKEKFKKVHRLQNDVPTRWNSSLHMINSLISLRPEVSNALKQTGHYDLCLKAHEWAELEELRNFLQTFDGLTDLVSSSITSLSLIPLIRAEIVDACKSDLTDGDSLKSLKKLILKSVDKRLPMTDDIILATLFDPSAKSLVSQLSDDGKEQLLYKAVREQARKAAMQNNTNSVSVDASATLQSAVSTSATESSSAASSAPGATLSKKMKLVQKHTPHSEQPDHELIEQIKNYLHYLPVADDEDPLAFWKKGLFPLLEGAAKKYLTRSASSVPVENMFSTMGLLLNGKRSTLAPHRANWLSFIHDNYQLYCDVA